MRGMLHLRQKKQMTENVRKRSHQKKKKWKRKRWLGKQIRRRRQFKWRKIGHQRRAWKIGSERSKTGERQREWWGELEENYSVREEIGQRWINVICWCSSAKNSGEVDADSACFTVKTIDKRNFNKACLKQKITQTSQVSFRRVVSVFMWNKKEFLSFLYLCVSLCLWRTSKWSIMILFLVLSNMISTVFPAQNPNKLFDKWLRICTNSDPIWPLHFFVSPFTIDFAKLPNQSGSMIDSSLFCASHQGE